LIELDLFSYCRESMTRLRASKSRKRSAAPVSVHADRAERRSASSGQDQLKGAAR
jgi:hypothetical protein